MDNIEVPLIGVLADMEHNGILIDGEKADELQRDIDARITKIVADLQAATGRADFNPNSAAQLRRELFDNLNLDPVKSTKGGTEYSTDKSVLEELAKYHEFPSAVKQYRELAKLSSTYVAALPKMVFSETGRIHCSFNQAVTATGRLSSSDPNLQNIPARTEDGKQIRKLFVSPLDHYLVAADYSQIELRVLAHYCKDPVLVDAFLHDADIHRQVASKMRRVPVEEITEDVRKVCKNLNFGVLYGQGPKRLAKSLDMTYDEAKYFIDAYFKEFPSIRQFRASVINQCARNGYVTTILGRRRYINGFFDPDYAARAEAERQAFNTVIQGSAADVIKLAMLDCYDLIQRGNLKAKLLLQVHDELVFEVCNDDLSEVCTLIEQTMTNVVPLCVPLKVDIEYGPSWGELATYDSSNN
jgi:DNA polymerase-1